MSITITVDANVILSALLRGKSSSLLFDPRFSFVTTAFTLREVKKYIPRLAKKLHVTQVELRKAMRLLPIKVRSRSFYQGSIKMAYTMIGDVDSKDIDVLALALELEAYLWSQDKDFEKTGYVKLLKTHDLIG